MKVDATRFRQAEDGYVSADVVTNPNRAEVDVPGPIMKLRVS
jgi:hypothetical protein